MLLLQPGPLRPQTGSSMTSLPAISPPFCLGVPRSGRGVQEGRLDFFSLHHRPSRAPPLSAPELLNLGLGDFGGCGWSPQNPAGLSLSPGGSCSTPGMMGILCSEGPGVTPVGLRALCTVLTPRELGEPHSRGRCLPPKNDLFIFFYK